MPNLRFQNEDWRQFSLSDNSIDAFISDQGIPLYGNIDSAVAELTRIAKKGALFRGTGTRGRSGVPNFDDRLAAFGWDVWHLRRNGTGDPTYCYSAQLKTK
jgi:ubiquinone/menaquinone biosynthesis C-methylase UbiE